jgi:hypothetical protein
MSRKKLRDEVVIDRACYYLKEAGFYTTSVDAIVRRGRCSEVGLPKHELLICLVT